MKRLLGSSLVLLLLVGNVCADDVCFSVGDAKRLVVELEQKRVLEQEVKEYEQLVDNLKEQNALLQEQNKLLREQIDIMKGQAEIYKAAYQEEVRRRKLDIFGKGRWFGVGVLVGLVVGVLVLH